jgi:hypothetical protein
MENDTLKSAWGRMATEQKTSHELKTLISERSHSLVKRIRRQFILETVTSVVFIITYYDFFDGDKKPFFANAFLVSAFLFFISHNIVAFIQMRYLIKGENIEQLLSDRLYKMKVHAITSGILRLLAICSFLVFFGSVIKFTPVKYWILAGAMLFFLVQMILFVRIWKGRIGRMKEVIERLRS